MKHFYFKYMKANQGIERLIEYHDKASNFYQEGSVFPISIYFGKWRAGQKQLALSNTSSKQDKKQISSFYDLANHKKDYYDLGHAGHHICTDPEPVHFLKRIDAPH